MEDMREGFLEKSNQGIMKGEESPAGTWGGGSLCRGEKRLGHSELAHSAETQRSLGETAKRQSEGLTGTRSGRVSLRSLGFSLRLCKQWCDIGTCSFRTTLWAGWGKGLKERDLCPREVLPITEGRSWRSGPQSWPWGWRGRIRGTRHRSRRLDGIRSLIGCKQ